MMMILYLKNVVLFGKFSQRISSGHTQFITQRLYLSILVQFKGQNQQQEQSSLVGFPQRFEFLKKKNYYRIYYLLLPASILFIKVKISFFLMPSATNGWALAVGE
jgi:hypothetical protein